MMMNLFSTFDPTSSLGPSLNWTSSAILFIMIPFMFWFMPSRFLMIWLKLCTSMHKELKTIVKNQNHFSKTLIFTSLLMFIMTNNFMGLFPYIFTSTSHLNFNLYLSVPLWFSFITFGWINNTIHMLAHSVPQGTPTSLSPFLVIVETISNIIRPGTLAIRLTANMIAGHLLIVLLSNSGPFLSTSLLGILIPSQIILLTLESAVSIIQSYVFMILVTLYSEEVV
uniref:ATP synthase subunit a n=1 Tax=Trigonopterus sp. 3 AH-2016 TaxID=1903837 RepID=A0A343C402_9CUCU|nr:ATP synthase F0 subunit 6 [Trigonopterus sp. 3 AH-2016]